MTVEIGCASEVEARAIAHTVGRFGHRATIHAAPVHFIEAPELPAGGYYAISGPPALVATDCPEEMARAICESLRDEESGESLAYIIAVG